jgi:hypothetical protein
MKKSLLIIGCLIAGFAITPAIADDKHEKGETKEKSEVGGRNVFTGKGRATGKGMMIYRDKGGKIRSKKGSEVFEGRRRTVGRDKAERHGKKEHFRGKRKHIERRDRHVERRERHIDLRERHVEHRDRHAVVYPRRRVFHHHQRQVVVYRPWGHVYHGYGYYYTDSEAFKWLAFTAITLKLLDMVSEEQQRLHEEAQIRATTVAVGESVRWSDGDASGWVTPVREGTSSLGRYCREFQQVITVGGKEEEAYGTACRNNDGSWEIIP